MSILVVDDNETNRRLVAKFLGKWGYKSVGCESGEAAIEYCRQELPSIVLMDIMMPGMNGHQAATEIKKLAGNRYIPIIFVTALKEDQALADSLEAGGDDFVTKPIDKEILFSKIKAHYRIVELNRQLEEKNSQLQRHNRRLEREHELVSHFFDRQQTLSDLDGNFLKYHTSAASAFNGDICFAKRRPDGGLNMMLGDFTGHGLTAAMGSLPVIEMFLRLTGEQMQLPYVARQLNRYLFELLPAEIFLAATLVHLDATGRKLSVWMGGLPSGYLVKAADGSKQTLESIHMPLGILNDERFDETVAIFDVDIGDRLYLCTDGVVEATDSEGRQFGERRLVKYLDIRRKDVIERVRTAVFEFIGGVRQDDDLSMMELTMAPIAADNDVLFAEDRNESLTTSPFAVEVKVNSDSMRSERALNAISDMLAVNANLKPYKGVLYTIISELYTNALEHGILGLDSTQKQDDESYMNYYRAKSQALASLSDAHIFIKCTLCENGERVRIRVSHNGSGDVLIKRARQSQDLHGWGMHIVQNLCELVSYQDDGRCVEVVYDTRQPSNLAALR